MEVGIQTPKDMNLFLEYWALNLDMRLMTSYGVYHGLKSKAKTSTYSFQNSKEYQEGMCGKSETYIQQNLKV